MAVSLLLVFQMFIGGGAYASPLPNPPVNSICHRDVVLGIVFDCFYKEGGDSDAETFQNNMHNLLADFSGTQKSACSGGPSAIPKFAKTASANTTTTTRPGAACSSCFVKRPCAEGGPDGGSEDGYLARQRRQGRKIS
jgi:hypothetical protein